MSIKVKVGDLEEYITTYLQCDLVPMIHGSPGIGKSQVVYALAKKYKLLVIDLRLAQCDPTDLAGFPAIDLARQKAGYMPMDTFPLEGEKIPDGYNGWILFMDEATSAPQAVQAAAYKIILDRMVGQRKLHKKVAIVAAGNLATDNAIVEEMSTALQSRMVHLEAVVDTEQWGMWANANGFDYRIPSYLNLRPENLSSFKPDHVDHTYACPRTWEFTNRLLAKVNPSDPKANVIFAGALGDGVGLEFVAFCQIFDRLPKISSIVANPKLADIPQDPSVLWALCGALSKAMDISNCGDLMDYIVRIPVEFQAVTLKQTLSRDKTLTKHKSIVKWVVDNGVALF